MLFTVKLLSRSGYLPLLGIFLLSTAAHSSARLGETAIQCADRYGSPKADQVTVITEKTFPLIEGAIHHTYDYKGWRIRAAFLELGGPAVRVEYQKIPGSGINPQIQDYELAVILKAETPNAASWTQALYNNTSSPNTGMSKMAESILIGTTGAKEWKRSDGAVAQLRPGSMIIRLDLPQARQFEENLKAKKEQQAKKSVPTF